MLSNAIRRISTNQIMRWMSYLAMKMMSTMCNSGNLLLTTKFLYFRACLVKVTMELGHCLCSSNLKHGEGFVFPPALF